MDERVIYVITVPDQAGERTPVAAGVTLELAMRAFGEWTKRNGPPTWRIYDHRAHLVVLRLGEERK